MELEIIHKENMNHATQPQILIKRKILVQQNWTSGSIDKHIWGLSIINIFFLLLIYNLAKVTSDNPSNCNTEHPYLCSNAAVHEPELKQRTCMYRQASTTANQEPESFIPTFVFNRSTLNTGTTDLGICLPRSSDRPSPSGQRRNQDARPSATNREPGINHESQLATIP